MTTLSVRSRALMVAAALLLLTIFFVPVWRIQLQAPQYPEGLGMLIRLNTITGLAPTDLNNINELNHYIGMKAIVPEAITVLRYMPWVVGALALFGLASALAGRRSLLAAWIVSFAIAGAAGLVEFYRWSYDYGHNLASDAVIKVPGMTYQPPLIGSKQLLNFTASSWPATGGWLAGIAFVLAVAALMPLRHRARDTVTESLGSAHAVAVLAAVALFASACRTADPVPIEYGRVDCDVCRMRISDARFGGELVTRTGKVRQFDAVECLASYAVTPAAKRDARSVWVSDFDHPGHLIEASSARFFRRAGPAGGMGAGLLAVAPTTDSIALMRRFATTPMTWRQVQALAERGRLREAGTTGESGDAS